MKRNFSKGGMRTEVKPLKGKVTASKEGESMFRKIWENDLAGLELLYLICLNKRNKVVCCRRISSSGELVDLEMLVVLTRAYKSDKIILARNHKNGSLDPSWEDLTIIQYAVNAISSDNIELLDYMIITEEGYCSLRENGLIGAKKSAENKLESA